MSSTFLETPYSLYPWICGSRHPFNIEWMTIPEPPDGMQRKIETSVFLKILMGSWWGMGWVCILQSSSTKKRWSWNQDPFSGWTVWGQKGSLSGCVFLESVLPSMIGSGSVALVCLLPWKVRTFSNKKLIWCQSVSSKCLFHISLCEWNTVAMVPGSHVI